MRRNALNCGNEVMRIWHQVMPYSHQSTLLSDKAFPQVIVFGLPKIAVQTTPLSDIPNLSLACLSPAFAFEGVYGIRAASRALAVQHGPLAAAQAPVGALELV